LYIHYIGNRANPVDATGSTSIQDYRYHNCTNSYTYCIEAGHPPTRSPPLLDAFRVMAGMNVQFLSVFSTGKICGRHHVAANDSLAQPLLKLVKKTRVSRGQPPV
jgi:hypothetical protein